MPMKKSIFYLTTAKVGLHSFTHSELSLLEQNGVPFILGLVQINKGPIYA